MFAIYVHGRQLKSRRFASVAEAEDYAVIIRAFVACEGDVEIKLVSEANN